jgi:hypothetical protein
LAVHVKQAFCAGAFVQIVDILCYYQQLTRPFGIQLGQGDMGGVRSDFPQPGPPRVVELVDQRGIAGERLGGRNILDPMPFPQPVGRAERLQPALGAHSGAGQDDDVARNAQSFSPVSISSLASPVK